MAHERENTLDAFLGARRMGATGIETDAWCTADGVAVLDHDGVIGGRMRRRRITELPANALPGHIPTVADLYAACGDVDLLVDVMDPRAAPATVAAAVAAGPGAPPRLWLCHTDLDLLAEWRPLDARVHLVHAPPSWRRVRRRASAHLAAMRERGIGVLNLHRRQVDAQIVALVHAAGLLAFAWDAQRPSHVRRLRQLGVDGIVGDHVDRLLDGEAAVA